MSINIRKWSIILTVTLCVPALHSKAVLAATKLKQEPSYSVKLFASYDIFGDHQTKKGDIPDVAIKDGNSTITLTARNIVNKYDTQLNYGIAAIYRKGSFALELRGTTVKKTLSNKTTYANNSGYIHSNTAVINDSIKNHNGFSGYTAMLSPMYYIDLSNRMSVYGGVGMGALLNFELEHQTWYLTASSAKKITEVYNSDFAVLFKGMIGMEYDISETLGIFVETSYHFSGEMDLENQSSDQKLKYKGYKYNSFNAIIGLKINI